MVEFRARFDANKNVQDLMKAKRLLIAGEEELKKAMYWHTENFNCMYNNKNIQQKQNLFFFKFRNHLMVLLKIVFQHPMML
jgi:hypothetical protein